MVTDGTAYAVNSKARGKVHRVTADTVSLPFQQQRVACGWHMKSTSIVYYARRLGWGSLCRKCFPRREGTQPSDPSEEGIEQFEDPCQSAP